MDKLEGYRTLIVAGVTFIYGALDKAAMLPEGVTVTDTANAIMVMATLFIGLRVVTKTKVGGK